MNVARLTLYLLLLIGTWPYPDLCSQSNDSQAAIDSLERVIDNSNGYAKVEASIALYNLIGRVNPERSIELGRYISTWGIKNDSQYITGKGWNILAIIFELTYQQDSLKKYCDLGIPLAEGIGDKRLAASFYNILSLYFDRSGQLDSAIVCLEEVANLGFRNEILINLGIYNQKNKNYVRAIELFQEGYDYALSQNNLLNQAIVASNLASLHAELRNTQEAKEMALLSIEHCRELKEEAGMIYSLATLVDLDLPAKEKEQYINEGLRISEKFGIADQYTDFKLRQARTFIENGEKEKAYEDLMTLYQNLDHANPKPQFLSLYANLARLNIERSQLDEAEIYLNDLKVMSENTDHPHVDLEYEDVLLDYYKAKGNYKAYSDLAAPHYQKVDSLNQTAKLDRLIYLQSQLDDAEQKQQIARLNEDLLKEENRRRLYILSGIAALLLMLAIIWFRNREIRRQKLQVIQEKKTSDQLKNLNQKLRAMDETKTVFFTNISHELRTPLTVISGMADQISENDAARKLIKRNSQNLLNLTNQILDLRKLEAGRLEAKMIQADLIQYLRYIHQSFSSLASSRKIELVFESEIDHLVMDFDEEKMLRITSNLLSNAIKFSPSNSIVSMVVNVQDEKLKLTIEDEGIGIPAGQLPHIFDRFYQIKTDDYSQHSSYLGGTGIGLTLTKEFVELLGGSISVRSEEGEGTKFQVLLPITNNAERLAPLTVEATDDIQAIVSDRQENPDHPRLLIVEDNEDVRKYLDDLLMSNYSLHFASDGKQGLDMAQSIVPDIIISDVMMPVMDGYELCKALRASLTTSHIPIILLTARADMASKLQGIESGADAYLSKPFSREELELRLMKLLELRLQLRVRYNSPNTPQVSQDPRIIKEDIFIQNAKRTILEHLDDTSFGIMEMCETLNLSRTQLHNKLKSLTGMSTSHFIRNQRLKQSTELLKSSELTISEIAYKVGFSNVQYFSRSFSREYDLTPREYRSNVQKDNIS